MLNRVQGSLLAQRSLHLSTQDLERNRMTEQEREVKVSPSEQTSEAFKTSIRRRIFGSWVIEDHRR
jgi:hypothetical protein